MTALERRKIVDALAETQRFIDLESPRDPVLRPIDVQKTLAFYVKHKAKLLAMLAQ